MKNIALHTDFTALDELLAINLDISLWTARKKLTAEDIGTTALPPEELASLGSKRVADPEALRIFGTLKARAVALLEKNGIRFMSGWAVPESKAGDLVRELVQIRNDFNVAKEAYLTDYDRNLEAWIAKHQQWGEIIRNSTVSSDHVRSRMDFRWQLYRVSPLMQHADDTAVLESGLPEEINGLGNTLFKEVASAAEEMLRRVYEGRSEVTHKALSPLRTLCDKLRALTFVEPHVQPVVEIITAAMSKLPKQGYITGPDLLMLRGLVEMLKDTDTLIEQAQKLINGYGPATVLDTLLDQGEPELAIANAVVEPNEPEVSVSRVSDNDTPAFVPQMAHLSTPNIKSMGLW